MAASAASYPLRHTLHCRIAAFLSADLGARPELPGPMAVTLSRRTLRVVESSDYWVCEKSDGERAMLLMTARPMG